MESNSSKVHMTVEEFSKLVQNRRDLYEAVVRNGFYLPKIKSTMITEEYMRNVISGRAFCPRFEDVKMLPCPRPPNVDVLIKKFLEICVSHNFTNCGVDDKHQPDKRWLLDFVSSFKPDDEIFKKNYLPPVKETKLSELKTIELPADFMKNLPQSTRRSRRKGLRITKEGLAGQKMERLKRLRKELGDSILEEEVKGDEKKAKVKKVRSTINDSIFKPPNSSTPTRTARGSNSGNNFNNSSIKPDSLNTSSLQPQAIHQSPGLSKKMDGITLGLG